MFAVIPVLDHVTTFAVEHWRDAVSILILWVMLYYAYLFFHATRGARIFTGLVGVWIALTLLSELLKLVVIGWILKSVSVFIVVAMVVIFQPELRRALAELGSNRLFSRFSAEGDQEFIENLCEMVGLLSKKRVGALIALEQSIELKPYLETGVAMDSLLSKELVQTIFHSNTALHDGGMIIRLRDERIMGAGCVFPLHQRELQDRSIGLRHRAGLGISEESDAIAIVVSEETGHISLAVEGKLEQNLKPEALSERLKELLFADPQPEEKDENPAAE
ncbi:MAG: diadenylate cyclase CdaA [Verrucomicrobiota bacterium]